jgi:hypothetical protein
VEVELDVGQTGLQGGGDRRQQLVGGRSGEPDGEPSDLAPLGALHVDGRGIDVREDAPGPGEQQFARRRLLDRAGRARQHADAELGLELADLLGQRRLRHVQSSCSATEMALLGDGDEVTRCRSSIREGGYETVGVHAVARPRSAASRAPPGTPTSALQAGGRGFGSHRLHVV